MDKIILIDTNNFIYKGKVVFKSNKPDVSQEYILVYNFFRNLRAFMEEFRPTKIFFSKEGKNNFRYKLFADYKANRIIKTGDDKKAKSKEDFNRQADIIFDLLKYLPTPAVCADEYEADDVLATLADNLKDEQVIIVSNDTDYIQLLQKGYKNLKIYNHFKKEYVTAPNYFYLSNKAITGDKSDNIPRLLSDKKAEVISSNINLLTEFLSTEENRANFNLNKKLIELVIIDNDKLQFSECSTNYDKLKEEFIKMELKYLVEDTYWKRFCSTFDCLK